MVHTNLSAPAVLVDEWAVDERLSRTLRQFPIATAYLNTGEAQFSCNTLRHQLSGLVDDEVVVVGH